MSVVTVDYAWFGGRGGAGILHTHTHTGKDLQLAGRHWNKFMSDSEVFV